MSQQGCATLPTREVGVFYRVTERARFEFDEGLCSQDPMPDDWYSQDPVSIRRARMICNECPVLDLCYEYAQKNDERFGMWGGLTEEERGFIHRTRF